MERSAYFHSPAAFLPRKKFPIYSGWFPVISWTEREKEKFLPPWGRHVCRSGKANITLPHFNLLQHPEFQQMLMPDTTHILALNIHTSINIVLSYINFNNNYSNLHKLTHPLQSSNITYSLLLQRTFVLRDYCRCIEPKPFVCILKNLTYQSFLLTLKMSNVIPFCLKTFPLYIYLFIYIHVLL